MPKDYFQGVVPRSEDKGSSDGGRSIRNIPIQARRERPNLSTNSPLGSPTPRHALAFIRRFALWGVAIAALAALGVVGAAAFRNTSVVVTPRTHPVAITEDIGLTAYLKDTESAANAGLTYDLSAKTFEAELAVPAHGYAEVAEKASGQVTIYNEFGARPIRLIKNTRFQTPDGLIFRIRDSVVVPAKRGASPGTITTTIYADQPGATYNIPATNRFTIPGLQGGEMFDSVYARSTAAFTGGFAGAKPKVSETDLTVARDKLRAALEEKARTEAAGQTLPGAVIFPALLNLSFETLPPTQGADGQAVVRERLVAALPLFPEALFASVLAGATRADAGSARVHITDASKLSVRRIASSEQKTAAQTLDILISGNAVLEWEVDAEALQKALAGTPKVSFQNVISSFEGIEDAHAYVRPRWRKTFPADPGSIVIDIQRPTMK